MRCNFPKKVMSELQNLINKEVVVDITLAGPALLRELQERLSEVGLYPKDKIDGIYGPRTRDGWAEFKRRQNQDQPRMIGPGSAKLLLDAAKKAPAKPKGGTLAERVNNCCLQRGFALDRRPNAVNILGLEGMTPDGHKNDDAPDRWNDSVGLLVFEGDQPQFQCLYLGTTEPGRHYTVNPLNPRGGARLQLGQHRGLWIVGRHRGYEAMQQIDTVRLVRDHNRNFLRDDVESVERGNGVNLHTTKTTGWRGAFNASIGQWSAGCVVIQKPNEFLEFMRLVKASHQYRSANSHRFDFTLLWKDWL